MVAGVKTSLFLAGNKRSFVHLDNKKRYVNSW